MQSMIQIETQTCVRSMAAPEEIRDWLQSRYDLGEVRACDLWAVAVHDFYRVRARDKEYFLRLSNPYVVWASNLAAIERELRMLQHARANGAAVVEPVAGRDGALLYEIERPEGRRVAALFTAAPGRRIHPEAGEQARNFGRAVAGFHRAVDDFRDTQERLEYDQRVLIEEPCEQILAALPDDRREEDGPFIARLAARLGEQMSGMDRSAGAHGVIGGDFIGDNHHIDDDNNVELFQLDFFGTGWRAYDLALFLWHSKLYDIEEARWQSVLEGYESVRPLEPWERDGFPAFVMAKHLFTMCYHISFAPWAGSISLDHHYWERHLVPLRAWAREWGM